jgi:hypothetical protein
MSVMVDTAACAVVSLTCMIANLITVSLYSLAVITRLVIYGRSVWSVTQESHLVRQQLLNRTLKAMKYQVPTGDGQADVIVM